MSSTIRELAQQLIQQGLVHTFGVTGSGASLDLITALDALGGSYHPTAHEAAAAIMAGAVTRLSGRLSAALAIKGPGLANLLPGIAYNYFENNPALTIAECFAGSVPSYRMHKRLNHPALLSSIVKGITSLSQSKENLAKLIAHARTEAPGPIHLELCECDVAVWDSPSPTPALLTSDTPAIPLSLLQAQRPVLIVGSLALRREWRAALAELPIPVFTTAAAKGVLDENLPHAAGVFTGDGKELALETQVLPQADVVIGIGLRNTEVLSPKSFHKPTWMLDEAEKQWADGFDATVILVEQDSAFIPEILEILRRKPWGVEVVAQGKQKLRDALLQGEWLPACCFESLNELTYPYLQVLDTGSFCTIGEHLWSSTANRVFLGSSNARYMGTGIPSAIGAAIGLPGFPVFCVVGDGGVRDYVAEIRLAIEEQLPICFVLMRDGRYGSVAGPPSTFTRNTRAVTIAAPSWVKAVAGMGCATAVATTANEFSQLLQDWNHKEPLFIEVPFQPEAYARMTEKLR